MNTDEPVTDVRPLLTRALHAACPQAHLIDCAAAANATVDRCLNGDTRSAAIVLALLRRLLDQQEG